MTKYIEANRNTLAYRVLGPPQSGHVPLLLLMHYRSNMDFWYPNLINPLAVQRPVIIFDNSGVGRSTDTVPNAFAAWGDNAIALMAALKIEQIDLLGFSMGGAVAQMVALNTPNLIRKLILASTRPSISPDTVGGLASG